MKIHFQKQFVPHLSYSATALQATSFSWCHLAYITMLVSSSCQVLAHGESHMLGTQLCA